jgi:nitronate monooxygenase
MSLPESFKHLRLPIVVSPMFLVSGDKLVIESCKSGVVGTFPALNQRTTEGFREWVQTIKKSLSDHETKTGKKAAPFGVNLIVHKSNPRLEADLKVCIEEKVPLIITSLGAVSQLVDQVHSYGGVVFHDVTTMRHAQKAAEAGVDGLIAVCAGAGGHAGRLSPFAFIGQLRSFFKKTIILAGAMSSGSDLLAARSMGADLAYMGTRFIATEESAAQDDYKNMVVDAQAEDIVYTPAVSGIPANFMRPSLEKAGLDMEALDKIPEGHKIDMGGEAKAWKTIWSAGHGVGTTRDILKTSALIDRMESEYKAKLASLQ